MLRKSLWGGVILSCALFVVPERSQAQTCDELANYSWFDGLYPLDANHEFHVTTNLTWNSSFNNMNVHGSIVIEPNRTLTIDNATIRFADSRHMDHKTNIIVRPGGDLVIRNGAVLTTLSSCPYSMWDGIKVLGNPALAETFSTQGVLNINTGASIRNAICAVATGFSADPYEAVLGPATQTGGIIVAQNASFVNNKWGVVLKPYNSLQSGDFTNTRFMGCTFETNAILNYGVEETPAVMLYAINVNRIKVGDCRFFNSLLPTLSTGTARGEGIIMFHSALQVMPLCGGAWNPGCSFPTPDGSATTNIYWGLFRAITFASSLPNKVAHIRGCRFTDNTGGVYLAGADFARVNRNNVLVPGGTYPELPNGALNSSYGIGFWNCTGFEVEENILLGPGVPSLICTGMVFSNTGDAFNRYYNNQFYGGLSFGTIIQHDNDGPGPADGLHFQCNDYGVTTTNEHDIAFTADDIKVPAVQGASGPDAQAPAGNTFSHVSGTTGERHMLANDGSVSFEYWHHDQSTTTSVVRPTSLTDPPTLNVDLAPTEWQYIKEVSCPSTTTPLSSSASAKQVMQNAEDQLVTLRLVYDAGRDGGDTEGLKDFIAANATNSYEIRNRLMLAAPRVSREVWEQVFALELAMNPWHLAQALLANSPLQAEVVRMMDNSGLTPYYKQLVSGAQGDGISMLSIQEAEMAYFEGAYDRALNDLTAYALESEDPGAIADVFAWEALHPQHGIPLSRIALLMANNDLIGAKAVVDDQLAAANPDAGMEVLGMYLDLSIAGLGFHDADAEMLQRLEVIANTNCSGQGQAQAWLQSIGHASFVEEIVLPREHRSVAPEVNEIAVPEEILCAYPNPASGKAPIYLVMRLPEGIGSADVQVFDATGRLVHSGRLAQNTGIVEVPALNLPSGLYVARVLAEGIELASTKVEVVR